MFFGGVDPDNLTGRTLEALLDPALAHLAVDVVLGRQSPHRQAVADLVTQRPFTTLHESVAELGGADRTGGSGDRRRRCHHLGACLSETAESGGGDR